MPKKPVTLEALGWSEAFEKDFAPWRERGLHPGRVAVEDKHHYVIFADGGPFIGKITGKLLHEAKRPAALPKVGDWVAFSLVPREEGRAIIHYVVPRRTKLSRKIAGRETEEQVLVTNVDIAFAVQALDRSFNPALLQRHLVMVNEGGVKPVVVLNKVDICDDVLEKLAMVEKVAGSAPVIAVSALTGQAMDSLTQLVRPGETIVFMGPSGVGKSSLINRIYGDEVQATTEVRESDAKGRHTTTWRELIVLPNGGLVIDTPGMREFHIWLADEGVHEAFRDIEALSVQCHFRNCSHTVEKRCAVLEAVERGELSRERYDHFIKLKRELAFLDNAAHQREFRERKRRANAARGRFESPGNSNVEES